MVCQKLLSKHRLQLPYAAPRDTAARMPNQPKVDIRVFNRFGDFFFTSLQMSGET